ncbi:DUF222 domain-containing protein [Nocardia sp. NBC_00511]|uniref:HNH endonuclease signature motif containing protein n=1 Tax=Nocardia sp. NBC_00511 TaxID=2903591 RepID=UPI0030E4B1E3
MNSGESSNMSGMADLVAAVNVVASTDFTHFSEDELTEFLQQCEMCKRVLSAMDSRLIIEVSDRSMPQTSGAGGVVRYLRDTLRLTKYDATCRAKVTEQVGEFRDPTGHLREPALAATAHAYEIGEISRDHVRNIVEVLHQLPDAVDAETRTEVETQLLDYSREGWPDDLPRIGREITARLDPDGSLTTDADRKRMRGLTIGRQRADGMSWVQGWIMPTVRTVWDVIISKYARPGVCNLDDPQSPNLFYGKVDKAVLEAAARRDTRTTAMRVHDALAMILNPDIDAAKLGKHRGLPVQAVITMSLEDLENAAGIANTATGTQLSINEALKMAAGTKPILAIFDRHGMPLHLRRARRLASSAQRLALIASEKGCTRPGCDAPPSMCAVHHVTDWAKGGPTDLRNLTLACDHCHALVNDGPNGWKTVVMGKDSPFAGRTGWIAPMPIDPTQTPRVNHRHHRAEQIAQSVARSQNRRARLAYQARIAHRAPE